MAKRTIAVELSPAGIDRAIKEIEAEKRRIWEKARALVEALTDLGVSVAKVQLAGLDAVYTGGLMESISGYFSPALGVGIIRAGAPYAVFVEFGTGVVGAGKQHPNPEGWVYDASGHGEKGWVYFNDRDGKWHWTQGMESRPFMYNTARELERECQRIAKEVFGT